MFSQNSTLNANIKDNNIAISQNRPTHFGKKSKQNHSSFVNRTDTFITSYLDKIPFSVSQLKDLVYANWKIEGNNGFSKKGKGRKYLQELVLNIPGNYIIEFEHVVDQNEMINETCFHSSLPSSIYLKVLPYKITFDFTSIQIPNSIKSGKETRGIQLSVDLSYQSYFGLPSDYFYDVITSGVNTTIVGKLACPVKLLPGKNTLHYNLEGMVKNPNTYISFDFLELSSGNIQSYYLTNSIL